MRFQTAIFSGLALASAASPTLSTGTAGAQVAVASPRAPVAARAYSLNATISRAVVGIATSVNGGARDTLGLLVASVTPGGPAEKAGIVEGNRIASINGVNLKLAAADLGDPDMQRLMGRRLTRELEKLKTGDEVELRVYADGQTKSVKLKTVDPDSLYPWIAPTVVRDLDDRATLGIGYGTTGSKRDTLGIFVNFVDDQGPAAKAGLEEGARIQSINGVDLRVAREDAGDPVVSGARLSRFEREMSKVKVGDEVELRVFQNGQVKTVKPTTVSWLDQRGRSRIIRNGSGVTVIGHPGALAFDLNATEIAATARRAAETAARVTVNRMDDIVRVIDEVGRGWTTGGTIRW